MSDRHDEYTHELRSYIWGFILALALTLAAFGLVYRTAMAPSALHLAIGAFAIRSGHGPFSLPPAYRSAETQHG